MAAHFSFALRPYRNRFEASRVVWLLFLAILATCAGALADTLDDIKIAWKKRSEAVQSAEFQLKQRMTFHKGRWPLPPFAKGPNGPQPPADVTFDRTVKMIFDGSNLRYESDGFIWDSLRGKLIPRRNITTFDGKMRVNYYPLNEDGHSDGQIEAANRSHSGRDVGILPIAFAFRPLGSDMSPFETLENADVAKEREKVDGHDCVVLEIRPVDKGRFASLYLDPACDFVARRCELGYRDSNGTFTLETHADAEYRRDEKTGIWVPSAWRSSWRPERAGDSFDVVVVNYTLNPVVPKEQFGVPKFAPGSFMYDMRNKSPDQTFYVKADGRLRPIPQEDLKLTRRELEATEPGYAKRKAEREKQLPLP